MAGGSAARRRRTDLRLSTPLTIATIVAALLCILQLQAQPYYVRALRDLVFDIYQRVSPRAFDASAPVRVVAIDDDSLARVGQWPWPRETMGELVEKLTQAGAAVTVIDAVFSEPERRFAGAAARDGDAEFAGAIARGRVVLGMTLQDRGEGVSGQGVNYAGDDPTKYAPPFGGALKPLPALREAAAGLGAMNYLTDRDTIVREVPLVFSVNGKIAPSLALEALRVAQGQSGFVIRSSNASRLEAFGRETGIVEMKVGDVRTTTSANGSIRVHFAGDRPERRIPAWKILAGEVDRAEIEGMIMLIGGTASSLYDLRSTPLHSVVAGVEIQAEVIESLIAQVQLTRPDILRGLEIIFVVVGCLMAIGAATRLPPARACLVVGGLVAVFVAGSFGAFRYAGVLVDPLWPTFGTLAPFAIATVGIYRQSEAARAQIRDAFSRYVSPVVVETLARDPSRLVLGGENRDLTVMFSDVRGFTARSETLTAEQVVQFLNDIHSPMTEHVLQTGGTLDKFIGDGMMAFWNAPLDHADPARAGLRCALLMHATITRLNEEERALAAREGRIHTPISIGIGLHHGPACVGNVGSMQRFDYSAIGDTVNTAARIEPLCKSFGVPILVSDEMIAQAPDFAFLPVGAVQLRGQQRHNRIYALHGLPESVTPAFTEFHRLHEDAVDAVESGAADALPLIKAASDHPLGQSYQKLYAVLVERWRERIAEPEALAPTALAAAPA